MFEHISCVLACNVRYIDFNNKDKGGSMKQRTKPDRGNNRSAVNFRRWPFRGILSKVAAETGLSLCTVSNAYRNGNETIIELVDILVEAKKKDLEKTTSRIAA